MTDTDVTFLSCYNTVGHTLMYVMTLTSPPNPTTVTPLNRSTGSHKGQSCHAEEPRKS